MKKLALLFLLISFSSCTGLLHVKDDLPPGKKIHYILLSDQIDKNLVDDIHSVLFTYKGRGGKNILQYLPDGTDEISFDIYHPHFPGFSDPLSVSFTSAQSKDTRREHAKNLMQKLDSLASLDTIHADDNILSQLEQVTQTLATTDGNYIIFISGSLANCAGAGIDERPNNPNWQNGEFHFINADGEMLPPELDEAKRQLGDSTQWIYSHLVAPARKKAALIKAHSMVYLDTEPANYITCNTAGRSTEEIHDFWVALLQAMHIHFEESGRSGYHFY